MKRNKGQGTTEYLIILAVIIVIALVVVGVMGWFPGLSTTISDQQSRAYWQGASPLAFTDWEMDTTDTDFVILNTTNEEIRITAITLDGTAVSVTDGNIQAGQSAVFTGSGVSCTSAGDSYSHDVVISYLTPNLSKTQTGRKPLIGNC